MPKYYKRLINKKKWKWTDSGANKSDLRIIKRCGLLWKDPMDKIMLNWKLISRKTTYRNKEVYL